MKCQHTGTNRKGDARERLRDVTHNIQEAQQLPMFTNAISTLVHSSRGMSLTWKIGLIKSNRAYIKSINVTQHVS